MKIRPKDTDLLVQKSPLDTTKLLTCTNDIFYCVKNVSIIKAVILYGRHNLSLRGHRDYSGKRTQAQILKYSMKVISGKFFG